MKINFAPWLLVAFVVSHVGAADLQTEWIDPAIGSTEPTLGARIQSIEELPDSAGQRLVIEIPKTSLEHRDDIPEIVITAQRSNRTEWQLDIPHAWLEDYDNDNYGLVLYLGRQHKLPLRLHFKTDE